MRGEDHKHPIDQMTAADSVLSLLRHLDPKKLPPRERMALAESKLRYGKLRLAAWKAKLLGEADRDASKEIAPKPLLTRIGAFVSEKFRSLT